MYNFIGIYEIKYKDFLEIFSYVAYSLTPYTRRPLWGVEATAPKDGLNSYESTLRIVGKV
jgi:hypothetical protein